MKFVFFGTPEFAEIVLDKLIQGGYIPSAVICNPDRPVGRKKIITPPPVKTRIMNYELGIKNQIKILQPEKLNPSSFSIHDSLFDLFVVAAYAKIIPAEILKIPRLGVIGVHPSLLPKHRGPSPIQSVILNGDKETGAALYLMDALVDHGPILESRKLKIESRINYLELERQLAELGGDLLVEVLPKFVEGEIKPEIQNEDEATFTKKFTTQDAFVNYSDLLEAENGDFNLALMIDRKIRAFVAEPGAWTIRDGKRVKLLEAEIVGVNLRLKKIQVEGERPKMVENSK